MIRNSHSGVVRHNPFAAPALEAVISMTPSQREILATARASELASCAYNNTIRISVQGKLDVDAVSEAASLLSRRHQSLRASFHADSRMMCIAREMKPGVRVEEALAEDAASADRILDEMASVEVGEPFDLQNGPLIRFRVARTSDASFAIFMVTHQLVVDHWSVDLLADEFAELYSSVVERRESELPPAFAYLDFARWLREPETARRRGENRDYWLEKCQQPVEIIEIIGTGETPVVRGYAAARSERSVPDALTAALTAAAAAEKSTFFGYTLGCYVALQCRLGGGGHVRVGIPAAGQLDIGENRLAGSCINTLPLTIPVDPGMTFRDCLQAVRKEMYSAQSYTPFTYTEIVADLEGATADGRLPVLTTMFNVDQENHVLAFSGLRASYAFEPRCADKFLLSMNVVSFRERASVQCHANEELFSTADRESLIDAYLTLLALFVEHPEARIGDAEIGTGSLRRAPAADHSAETALGDAFEASHVLPGQGTEDVLPSAAYARWQAEAVTEEFALQLPAAPHGVVTGAATAAPGATGKRAKRRPQHEQESLYFGSDGELYGIYYPVAFGKAASTAFLLCGPHGDEAVRSHRLTRSLSNELQKKGIPSLRFDYFGQGDSAGNDAEATLEIWRDNVIAARDELAKRSGCDSVVGAGIRIGANLLLDLGCKGEFDDLILIDAIRNGQAELEAWRQKNRWMLRDVGKFRFGRFRLYRNDQFEELAGFCYGRSMLEQISAISIDVMSLPKELRIQAVGLGNSDWSSRLQISIESAGDSPEWNNAGFMQNPIVNRDLVNLVCSRAGAGE
jgi:Condensation domain